MDLGIASPINAVHMDTVFAGATHSVIAKGPTVVLVAASVATRVKVSYEGSMVLVAYVPAAETTRLLLAGARGVYGIEVTNRDHVAADIYVTLEPTSGHPG